MRKVAIGPGSWMAFFAGVGIVAILILASGTMPLPTVAVQATSCTPTSGTPCTIGDLNVISTNTVAPSGGGGGGGCGPGVTVTILNNSNGQGFEDSLFGGQTTCVLSTATAGTFTATVTLNVQAINGFLLDDGFGTFNCGVSGTGNTASLAFDLGAGPSGMFTLNCPSLTTPGTMLEMQHVNFTPTGAVLAQTITLTGTFVTAGSLSLNEFSLQDSLVNAPEPGTLALFGSGLVALAGAMRRRLPAR